MKRLISIFASLCMTLTASAIPAFAEKTAEVTITAYNSNEEHSAEFAADGDISTYWEGGEEQKKGEWVSADLGEAKYVVSVSLRNSEDMSKYYPRKIDIYISNDPDNLGVPIVSGLTGYKGDNTIYMPRLCHGRYIRVMVAESTSSESWRIGEIEVKTAKTLEEAKKAFSEVSRLNREEKLLSNLNITEKKSLDYGRVVTRGEFCAMVAGAMNANFSDSMGGDVFSDVPRDHKYSGAIETAKTLGIISPSDTFEPDRAIAYNEAVRMVVAALGYSRAAELTGGYPSGYIKLAQGLKITRNVGREMNYGDCVTLIYNMLDTGIYNYLSSGGDVKLHSGKTALDTFHNIETTEGIVTANNKIALTGNETTCRDGEVIISKEHYGTGKTDISDFVGYNVKVYIKEDEIISFDVLTNKNTDLQIDSADIERKDSDIRSIAYYNEQGDKKLTAKISPYADIIYNFRLLEEYTIDDLIPLNGRLELIDNNGDNCYDVVLISSYAIYTVQQASKTSITVYDKFGMGALCLDNPTAKLIDYYDANGNAASFDSIKENTVIKVKAEYEKKMGTRTAADVDKSSKYEIICCDRSVSGSVTAKKEKVYEIDGVYYEISDVYSAAQNDGAIIVPSVSDNGIFYLDEKMRIVSSELRTKENVGYGYIIKAGVKNSAFDDRTQIKLLTQSGEIKTMECAERVTVDGMNYITVTDQSGVEKSEKINASNLAEFLQSYRSLITYTSDYEGVIRKIDTANISLEEIPETSLKVGALIKNADYNYWRSMLLSKKTDMTPSTNVLINNNVKLFVVPGESWLESARDDDYFVTDKNYFVHDKQYTFRAVNMSEVNVPEMLIVYCTNGSEGGNVVGRNSPYVMVNEICQALNDDGEVVTAISAYYKGAFTDFYINDEKVLENAGLTLDGDSALHCGDLLQIEIGGHKALTAMKRVVSVKDMKEMGANPEDYYQDWRETFASVYARKGNAVSLSVSLPVDEIKDDTVLEAYFIPENGMMYDSELDKVVPFASDEIKAYKTMRDKNAASKVFIVTSWAEIKCFAVYN